MIQKQYKTMRNDNKNRKYIKIRNEEMIKRKRTRNKRKWDV